MGANASVAAVVSSCPALFVFCFLQIGVHLGLTLGAGKALGFSRKEMLLSSNANVGGAPYCPVWRRAQGRKGLYLLACSRAPSHAGPTTAAGMASAKGWRSMLVPCLLVGTFGYAIATPICCALGLWLRTWPGV